MCSPVTPRGSQVSPSLVAQHANTADADGLADHEAEDDAEGDRRAWPRRSMALRDSSTPALARAKIGMIT